MYHYSARKLNQDEYLKSEWTGLTFLVSNLLMAIWFHQTAVMFIVLPDNSLMKGAHRTFNWACCSKNGQLLIQPRELRNLLSQLLKTSEAGDCRISLGKLLPCLIGHMGKKFLLLLHWKPTLNFIEFQLLSCPFQVFWTLYLQSSSHGIPSTHFLNEPKPGFLQPRICTQLFPLLTCLRIFKSTGSWALK